MIVAGKYLVFAKSELAQELRSSTQRKDCTNKYMHTITCALNIDLNPDQRSFRDKNMDCKRDLYLHRLCCNASIVIFADHIVFTSHTIVLFGPAIVLRDKNMKCCRVLFCTDRVFLLMMCCLCVIL